jgi:hemerythrin superfamily protein
MSSDDFSRDVTRARSVDDNGDEEAAGAIDLLTADHTEVRQLFAEYEELMADDADDDDRLALALEICVALTVHATAEEEIFYPAARAAIQDKDLLDDAEAEHASARALIETIQGMEPSDERFDATVQILAETIEHHVQEEEGELFPRVLETDIDLMALGEQIEARKEELLAELDDEAG